MSKEIIFICQYLAKGGAERVLSLLINSFAERGYSVKVVLLYENSIDYSLLDNIELINLRWGKKTSVVKKLGDIKYLRDIVKGNIVISFLFSAIRIAVLTCIFNKTKLILSERNDPNNDPIGKWRQCFRTFLYFFADIIVFQTEEQRMYFPEIIQSKGVIIENPIMRNIPKVEGDIIERDRIIVSVCRYEMQKNIKMAIDAFELFKETHPDFKYHIYGKGDLEEDILEYIREKKLQNSILLKGYDLNVHEKIRNAAMYISSSDYEGISNSMLEAMAMGLPVICTDCPIGGARHVIKNEINGLLVDVGNFTMLAECMSRVVDNPVFSNRMSQHALEIGDFFSEEKIIDKWIEII